MTIKEESPELIKIYGLQRSGTNYITHLLNTNFQNIKVLVNAGGWKHGTYNVPFCLGREVHCVCMVKNPYAWLRSVYEYWGPNRKKNIGPNLKDVSFEDFIKSRAIFEKQKGVPFLFRAENPIQYWNNMNYHYHSIVSQDKKICLLTYEALLSQFENVMLGLSNEFEIMPSSNNLTFSNCSNEFVPSGEEVQVSNNPWDKLKYYTDKEYLKYYTPEMLGYVNSHLDIELKSKFEYEIELKPKEMQC